MLSTCKIYDPSIFKILDPPLHTAKTTEKQPGDLRDGPTEPDRTDPFEWVLGVKSTWEAANTSSVQAEKMSAWRQGPGENQGGQQLLLISTQGHGEDPSYRLHCLDIVEFVKKLKWCFVVIFWWET